MTTKIICWARTPNDTRDTASATLEFLVTSTNQTPTAIAKKIDDGGSFAVRELFDAGSIIPAPHNNMSYKPATGHGVTIVFPSGKSRTIRAN